MALGDLRMIRFNGKGMLKYDRSLVFGFKKAFVVVTTTSGGIPLGLQD